MPILRSVSVLAAGLLLAASPLLVPAIPAQAGMAVMSLADDRLPEAEKAALKTMFETATQALVDGDLDLWESYWTEDAVAMPPGLPAVEGREALVAFAKKSLGALDAVALSDWTFEGRDDFAVVSTAFEWTDTRGGKQKGKQVVVAVKNAAGAWKAQRVIYNLDGRP